MRRLLHVALALAACAQAAPRAALDADALDADRLPGWLGEQGRDAQAVTPDRWIEPIAWEPRCEVCAAARASRETERRPRRAQRVPVSRLHDA